MPPKSRLMEAARSLRERPIPIFAQETLDVGVDFFWRQLAIGLPVYLLVASDTLTGQRPSQLIPGALQWVVLPALVAYLLWAIGTAYRWRRGQPPFTAPGEIVATIKAGWSVWWRAFSIFIRFILLFLALGLIAGVMHWSEGTTTFLGFVLWVLVLIPSWGFAVRFWDRTKELAAAGAPAPDPVPSAPVSSRSGMAIVAGAWVVAALLLGPPTFRRLSAGASIGEVRSLMEASDANAALTCRTVKFGLSAVSPSARYEVDFRGDSSGLMIRGRESGVTRGVDGGVGSVAAAAPTPTVRPEWTVLPLSPTPPIALAFGDVDDIVYLEREGSDGRLTLSAIPLLGGSERVISYDAATDVALSSSGTGIVVARGGLVQNCGGVIRW